MNNGQTNGSIRDISFKFIFIIILLLGLSVNAHASISDFTNPGVSLSQADSSFLGEINDDGSGRSIANAGDVDGDGLDDIMIAAYRSSTYDSHDGKVYIILGSNLASGTVSLADADYELIGESGSRYAGYNIAGAGDVDGDGLDDIMIGTMDYRGYIYIVLGKSLTSSTISLANADYIFTGETDFDNAIQMSSAGDVDGDGLDDILIGATGNSDYGEDTGKTYLILGGTLASGITSLAQADYTFYGENIGDSSGSDVASAGDVDGDGFNDVLIGANLGNGATGAAYIILASSLTPGAHSLATADYILYGENIIDWAGDHVGSAGDVDGDGLSDVLIGAQGGDIVYLILGRSLTHGTTSLAMADYSFTAENSGDFYGGDIISKTPGDVDGDGLDDILLGAAYNDDVGSEAGKAYVFLADSLTLGSTSVANADYIFTGEFAEDRAGSHFSFTGDVNDDGVDDILIGAFKNDEFDTDAGKTYLILGQENCLISANAGPDQIVTEDTFVTLDGTSSVDTCNYGTLTYSWELTYGTETSLSDDSSDSPTFKSGVDGDIYVFTLTVEVLGYPVDADSVVITVSQNQAPIASNTNISTYANYISLTPSASDPNGDSIVGYYYQLTRMPRSSSSYITESGYTTSSSTIILLDRPGSYLVRYRVYDGQEWSNTATMTVQKYKLIELPDSNRY
jgi:hypothetical protein